MYFNKLCTLTNLFNFCRSVSESLAQHTTVAKVAELKKLKTGDYGSHVEGPELSNAGVWQRCDQIYPIMLNIASKITKRLSVH